MGLYTLGPVLAAALWWGSLSAVGAVVVPVLFAQVAYPVQAAGIAAALFAAQTWISIACCLVLLVISKRKYAQKQEEWARAAMVFVLGGLLLALVAQYGVAPRVAIRQNPAIWHNVAIALYALQWLCALGTLWMVVRYPAPRHAPEEEESIA